MEATFQRIYMDHHATTPLDPRVLEVMMPYLTNEFGNASSNTHVFGWRAKEAVELARQQVARLIGSSPKEIIFTNGATESDNLAIKGIAQQYRRKGNHLITSQIEHSAILESCKMLEKDGFEVTFLPVDQYGMVDPQDVKEAITDHTRLISIIYASNEVGTINPLTEIGEISQNHGVLFHSDAVQGIGKIESNVDTLKVDLMSLTAHKMYGPKGIGALHIRSKRPKIRITPQNHGGGQEAKIRSGTLNVPSIVGFGKACEIAQSEMAAEAKHLTHLRNQLRQRISENIDFTHVHGHPEKRLPGNLNISFEFVESLSLLENLSNIALSTGSACSSSSIEASRVLVAMGVEEELARAPIRFGLGRGNTLDQVNFVAAQLAEQVTKLRDLSSMYKMVSKGGYQTV